MVDWDDLNIFSKYSTGTFALVSGMAMIGTATFIIYAVYPKITDDPNTFFYSIIALCLTAVAPLLFYIGSIIDFSDIIGKFSSGIVLAAFVTLLYHVTQSRTLESWYYPIPHILLTGVFSFITSFLFVRGVVVPIVKERQEREETEWDEEEEGFEYEEKEPEYEEEFEEEKFLEEEEEPW